MQGSNVKIYPDEMVKLKETSLEMRDGSGSLAVLGVYHELHCVVSNQSLELIQHFGKSRKGIADDILLP